MGKAPEDPRLNLLTPRDAGSLPGCLAITGRMKGNGSKSQSSPTRIPIGQAEFLGGVEYRSLRVQVPT